jgi:ADP-ribose pyrophosphatase YjhB (NUDIX family)
MTRLQAVILRDRRLLLARHRVNGEEWWCLPGGGQEDGETPEQGVLRELREECNVDGRIARLVSYVSYGEDDVYTYVVDIGNQTPVLGTDPEVGESEDPYLIGIRWLRLSEVSEKDRAYMFSAGILILDEILSEVETWGDLISYPGEEAKADFR